jgi:glucosamine--fructose-6-phosphate aminotransferase (isomerizing)
LCKSSKVIHVLSNYITLYNDDICIIEKTKNNINVTTKHTYLSNKVYNLICDLTPDPYKHWTLKEIYEQPNVVLNSINKGGRIQNSTNVKLGGLEVYTELFTWDNILNTHDSKAITAAAYFMRKYPGVI